MTITNGTILKVTGTGATAEVIEVNDKYKTAIVKFDDGSSKTYSFSTLKDKRRFTEADETDIVMAQKKELGIECPPINPDEVTIEEITCTTPGLVPMPGIEKLSDLKAEYNHEEELSDEGYARIGLEIAEQAKTKAIAEQAKKKTRKRPNLKLNEVTYNGETKKISEWAKQVGIDSVTLYNRINRNGWPIDLAITTPKGERRPK